MSIWRYMFDNEWIQRADIEQLRSRDRSRARSERRGRIASNKRIDQLEDEVGELALLCRSLLTALRESGHLDPARFEEVLRAVDLEDGVADGQFHPQQEEKPTEAPVRRKRR